MTLVERPDSTPAAAGRGGPSERRRGPPAPQRRRRDRRAAPGRHPRGDGRPDPRRASRARAAATRRRADPRAARRPGSTSSPRSSVARRPPARSPPPDEDIVARARAYEAGGAAAISVLCEPHWFGGSVDDLRAVRAAVASRSWPRSSSSSAIQLPHLRAAGADLVLLLAVLHPAKRLARLVDRALEIGLEPLVEAHDERELERALATDARLIGINNRDLRTLEVDTDRAIRLRALVPDDRLVDRRVRCPRRRDDRRAGAPSGSTPRSSARRSSAPAIRPPRSARSSPPARRPPIPRTARRPPS